MNTWQGTITLGQQGQVGTQNGHLSGANRVPRTSEYGAFSLLRNRLHRHRTIKKVRQNCVDGKTKRYGRTWNTLQKDTQKNLSWELFNGPRATATQVTSQTRYLFLRTGFTALTGRCVVTYTPRHRVRSGLDPQSWTYVSVMFCATSIITWPPIQNIPNKAVLQY
jgi:hypothetical protein